jgi:hypothetical protein
MMGERLWVNFFMKVRAVWRIRDWAMKEIGRLMITRGLAAIIDEISLRARDLVDLSNYFD